MATSLKTDLALAALEQAIEERQPNAAARLVHHSDRGVQYLAIHYTTRLLEAGIAGRSRDEVAVAKLRQAIAMAESHDMKLHAAPARYQLGKLLGGSEGNEQVASATRVMLAEGIRRPERFADWYVPGLEK